MFYSIQYKNSWLAASEPFDMFTQSVKFYYVSIITYVITFHYHVQMFEKCDSSNRQQK